MTSFTLTLSGNSSTLAAEYFPPIELDRNSSYTCCLVDFQSYNSLPNITHFNNKLYIEERGATKLPAGRYSKKEFPKLVNALKTAKHRYTREAEQKFDEVLRKFGSGGDVDLPNDILHKYVDYYTYTIPPGSYEFDDIVKYFEKVVPHVKISLDKHTNMCTIESTENNRFIDFTKRDSIRHILGFGDRVLEPNIEHVGDRTINITNINAIRIDCNIATGSFVNGRRAHNIHEFYPEVAPGYKIVEVPKNLIYLPVIGHTIRTLRIDITDQDGNLVDFRGETVTCRIHIKKEQ